MLAKSERDLGGTLDRMREEAGETERRCTELVSGLDGKKTAILTKARAVKKDAAEMMSTYLEGEDEALDGFEFLTGRHRGDPQSRSAAPDGGLTRIAVPVDNVGAAGETVRRVLEVTGDDGFGVVRLQP